MLNIHKNFPAEKFISAGTNALVYGLNDDWVLRRSMTEKDGFRVIPHLPRGIIETFNLPRIDLERSDLTNHVYVVERLYRADYMEFINCEEAQLMMNNFHHPCGFKGFCLHKYLDKQDYMYDITYKCYKVWRYLRSKNIHVSIDLNPSNIMQRKDGTLILSDPFGCICDF